MTEPIASRIVRLADNVERVVQGKRDVVELAIVALLARGHLLLEDVPGTGKTTLARALARSFDGAASRVQFTPDLLPSDITGSNIYRRDSGEFVFQPGPIFAQVVLADEINRGTPRTQSSLLECMQERAVTIDGTTRPLPDPFFVVATQNPVEFQGTYPLPEAQLDRFTLRVAMGYPDRAAEGRAILGQLGRDPLDELSPVLGPDDVAALQAEVAAIHVDEKLLDYILGIIEKTRRDPRLRLGASPRGAICLTRAAQAHAALEGRAFISPYDIKHIAVPALAHRVLLSADALVEGVDASEVIAELVEQVPVPTLSRITSVL